MKIILSYFLLLFPVLSIAQNKLNLEDLVSLVLKQNFDLQLERNNVQVAANNNNPGNAGYLPTITLEADQNWSRNNTRQQFFSGQVNEASGAKNKSTNAAVRLNWTLFDGFKMFAADKRLQEQENLATIQLTAEMEMKIYQTAVFYYTILQLQKMTPVYKQALELSVARYDLINQKLKNGAATRLQLIQARLDLTADSSVLLQHNKQLADLKIDLSVLMGQKPSPDFELGGTLLSDSTLRWETALQQAKEQNTQVLITKSAIAISEMQRKEAQSFYYPQVAFYSQYAFAKSENQIGILNSNRSYGTGIGFTLTWNILDQLSGYTNLKNTELLLQNTEIFKEKQNQLIESELRKSFNEYEWANENMKLEQQSMLNAEETFSITQQALLNGAITNLELREIQFSVIQAQSRLLTAQLALKTAELNISLATGSFKKLLQ